MPVFTKLLNGTRRSVVGRRASNSSESY
eukprot:SAG11_NODE_9697_length_888_cov_14.760456_1_plen_27_part_10